MIRQNNKAKAAAASNTAARASRSPAAGVRRAAGVQPANQKRIVKRAPQAAAAAATAAPIEEIKHEEEEKKAPIQQKTAVELAMEKNNATLARLENFQQNSKSNALQEKMRKLQAASEIVINGVGKCEEIRERIQAKMANKMDEAQETNEKRFMERVKQAKHAN